MTDNPLGIMYFAYDRSGRPGLGFAAFDDQSPVASHNGEWSEILAEILDKGSTPVMLKVSHQSEFFDAAANAPKST